MWALGGRSWGYLLCYLDYLEVCSVPVMVAEKESFSVDPAVLSFTLKVALNDNVPDVRAYTPVPLITVAIPFTMTEVGVEVAAAQALCLEEAITTTLRRPLGEEMKPLAEKLVHWLVAETDGTVPLMVLAPSLVDVPFPLRDVVETVVADEPEEPFIRRPRVPV